MFDGEKYKSGMTLGDYIKENLLVVEGLPLKERLKALSGYFSRVRLVLPDNDDCLEFRADNTDGTVVRNSCRGCGWYRCKECALLEREVEE